MRLEIDGWATGLRFSACHFLPGHRKCGRLHGHTYAVNVRLEGESGEDGYIADFFEVKSVFRKIIDGLDHRVLVPARSRRVRVTVKGRVLRLSAGRKEYEFPRVDVALLEIPQVTAEELASYILERAAPAVEKLARGRLRELHVGLYEGIGQGAWAEKIFRATGGSVASGGGAGRNQ
ncbi:MAG: 6-pyruvoyl tetrahydropterin synthase family protein [Thermoplasmata archaeon]